MESRTAARLRSARTLPVVCLMIALIGKAAVAETPEIWLKAGYYGTSEAQVGEWTGDGLPDLARVDGSELTVFANDGRGSFSPFATVDLPEYHSPHFETADLNDDGLLDFILFAPVPSRFAVVLSDGQGGFLPPVSYFSQGRHVRAAAAGDLDGDGNVELAVANEDTDQIIVFRGNGDGTFDDFERVPVGSDPVSLAMLDVNGDENLDMVVANSGSGTLSLFLGDGSGELSSPATVPAGTNPVQVLPIDLDGDAHPDLAVVDEAGGHALFLTGDGTGGFDTEEVPAGEAPRWIDSGDADGDGTDDYVIADYGRGELRVMFGQQGGGIREESVLAAGRIVYRAAFVDVDLDGHLDVVGNSAFFFGTGTGGFGNLRNFELGLSAYSGASRIEVADLDLDGIVDFVTTDRDRNTVGILLSERRLQLRPAVEIAVGDSPRSVLAVNLREDPYPDLVVTNRYSDELSVLLGGPGGQFSAATNFGVGPGPDAIASADFDEDGHVDLAVGLSNGTVNVLFGDGNGGFRTLRTLSVFRPIEGVTTGDFNDDGHVDIATVGGNGFHLFLGTGTTDLVTGHTDDLFSDTSGILSGHFNEDDVLDLAILLVGYGNPLVAVVLGGADASFAVHWQETFFLGAGDRVHAPVDLDEDGFSDLVLPGRGEVHVYRALGDGTFDLEHPRTFLTAGGSIQHSTLASEDWNGDGHADLFLGLGSQMVFVRNRTFEHLDCRAGNVNKGTGDIADVLFLNGSAGEGIERKVGLGTNDPFELSVAAPPSNPDGPSPFALYAWLSRPAYRTVEVFPKKLGNMCMSSPANGGLPTPIHIWNNLGFESILGSPDDPSDPAPSTVLSRPSGLGISVDAFFQGVMLDDGAAGGRAAITNGIAVSVK